MHRSTLALAALMAFASTAFGQISIDFEGLGSQPTNFGSTQPLTNQFPGVVFAGPLAGSGGAILNVGGNFGVTAHSGQQFLAFNRFAGYSGGGTASDPETITFTQPMSSVSIWAAGGTNADTFTMNGFNAAGALIASTQATSQNWVQLQIQAPGIVRVELVQSGDNAFVYDDLDAVGVSISTYCTAGTTTHGCVASIAGTGTPSGTSGSGFTISVSSVEGQKSGLLFYGVDNSGFAPLPWGMSTSFLCVKAPVQRMFPQSTGGTLNQCDGSLAIDWNNFVATQPGVLGSPFSSGQAIYAQSWFRDPPSPKTTMLSDALQFTLQ